VVIVLPVWLLGRLIQRVAFVDLKIAMRGMLATKGRGASTLVALVIGIFTLSVITMLVDSITNALEQVRPDVDFVAVHDAARPCLATEWIDKVFAAAERTGAAILAIPVSSTLKRVGSDQRVAETLSRADLWEAQTPQVFRRQSEVTNQGRYHCISRVFRLLFRQV
ncbi:MAG: hypothetical protein HGB05_20840, partial [Chloroflexi bacterium]|nr:hypothetical protein [Chloroflexota bacterium]